MDKVTHFLLIVVLIMLIIFGLLWFMGSACMAGYFSTMKVQSVKPMDLRHYLDILQSSFRKDKEEYE